MRRPETLGELVLAGPRREVLGCLLMSRAGGTHEKDVPVCSRFSPSPRAGI